MRVGQNPAKFVNQVAKPERITVAVLNYIPFVSGFYAEMTEVLDVCLDNIRKTADLPYDLLVFDNGSCKEVRDALVEQFSAGKIQYLLLSEKNLGKGGAWNIMLSGAPGELIAYTDNDCLFYDGWLSKSVEILETFPNVGMVTARPFRTNPEYYSGTVSWGEDTPEVAVEKGNFIPYEVFREFDLSLGQTEEEIREHYESSEDVRLTYQGVAAIAGASHWQFLAKKSVLEQFLPFDMDRPMGQVKRLDQRLNEAGYLRLMPTEPYAMNMSNTLRNLSGHESKTDSGTRKAKESHWLLDFPVVKRVLLYIYNRIFRWYYDRN